MADKTYTTPNGTQVNADGSIINPNNAATGVANSTVGTTGAPGTTSNTAGDFMSQLQGKLLDQSGIVSSNNTGLQDKINQAITGVQQGAKDNAAAVTSQYNRQETDAQTQGQTALTSATESQRGYATNNAALQQLTDNTNKQVKDLEQRKQELILQGNSQAAGQVATMQLQAIQFQQQAQQQVFSNLLGIANFGVQANAQAQQQKQFDATQSFNTSQAVSNVALKYGLTVGPGETLASITAKAAPFASAEEKQQMALATAQIAAANAQVQESLASAAANKPMTDVQIAGLAAAYASGNTGILANIKNPNTVQQVLNLAADTETNNVVKQLKASGISKADAQSQILSSAATATSKSAQLKVVDSIYGSDSAQPKQQSFSLGSVFNSIEDFGKMLLKEPQTKR